MWSTEAPTPIIIYITPQPFVTPAVVKGSCDALVPLYDALLAIDSRLSVGMPFAEYSTAVGDAAVEFGSLDAASLSVDCLEKANHLGDALMAYSDANERWDRCLFEQRRCTNDDIIDELREWWTTATEAIIAADM